MLFYKYLLMLLVNDFPFDLHRALSSCKCMMSGAIYMEKFEPGLLTLVSRLRCCAKKREGKARSAGHNGPMVKLCNAAPAFFRAQPEGTGRNFIQPIVTRRLQSLLCCAAHASFRLKSRP
jgi:hypothetical protein